MGGSHSRDAASASSQSLVPKSGDVEAATGGTSKESIGAENPERIRGLTRLLTAENQRMKDNKEYEDDTLHHKENMNLLKQLFKKMDPSILKTSTHSDHGDVQLSFKYDPTRDLLIVKVICCRDLDPKDLRGKSADPYVKLILFTEAGAADIQTTQTIKRSLNPTFNELFTYTITEETLREGRLVVQVWDYDVLEKDDLIGETIVPLGTLDFFMQPIHTGWFTLRAETNLTITGDLEVSLNYQLPDKLTVNVHRGNNLTNTHGNGKPNPVIKLQIPGIQSVFETQVQYDTVNPEWEETFEFTVPQEELEFRYVVLHAIDYDDGDDNESLGQVIVELSNLDISTGYHGKFDLADLRNSERLRAKWFQAGTVQEFRESLVAHAAFRHPKFLFARHSGTKVVKVTSRKAKAEAKLRVVNGIPVY